MPPVNIQDSESNAFTVINHDAEKLLARNVNVVRPLERDEAREPQPSAPRPRPAPNTLLDPKFSRALDFKLRRLKEQEILEANLRRPTRYKSRNGLAASNPNICKEYPANPSNNHTKRISQSHPRIDVITDDHRTLYKPPSPTKSRSKMSNDGDKPRFVTTVKTGEFLLPPPELACLMGLETLYPPKEREKIVYSYASKPKAVVSNRLKRSTVKKEDSSKCPNIEQKRMKAGDAFRGVRALIAGVAGVHHLSEERDKIGSMATAVTGATAATGATQYSNVMHDKRVVRGSTFAAHPQAAGDGVESAAARAARTRRRALARRAALARLRPGTPPPAPGRRHHPIQTEYYLEELFDKGVEMEVGVQTDLFVDRPPTPVYVPAKTGADVATQIYPGDLFDFDLEVQPILEVLIGKTVEQALAEVAQEEELETLREQQRRYRELRDAELAERQRLAAQDQRLEHEKERRVAEGRAARAAAQEARQRVAAAALVQGYVAELLPAVLAGLRDAGYLVRAMHRGVEEEFMPWLVEEVSKEIESIITSRDVISEIVREVVEARAELYRAAGEREYQRVEPPESITPPSVAEEEEINDDQAEPTT